MIKKMSKKALPFIMALAMLLSSLPATALPAQAASDPDSNTFDLADGSITISAGTDSGVKVSYGASESKDNIPFTDELVITQSDSGASTGNTITVDGSITGTVNITLGGVNISSADGCVFSIGSGSAVSLTLDGSSFRTSGSVYAGLQIPVGAELPESSEAVAVAASDTSNNTYGVSGAVSGTDVNTLAAGPTGLSLSSSSVAENTASESAVGTLSTTGSGTFTYSLVTGSGGTDNGSFTIDGASLELPVAFDYETKTSYSIRIRTTESAGSYYEKAFTISVTNVNEAPAISSGTSVSVVENTSAATAIYTAAGSDPEDDDITWSIGGTDSGCFDINGGTGALTFKTSPDYDNPDDDNTDNIYCITVTATSPDGASGTLSSSIDLTVTVTQESHYSGGGSGSTNTGSNAEVIVNGTSQKAGTSETKTNSDGRTQTTVTVNTDKLQDILDTQGSGATITIPITTGSDIAAGVLTGEMVRSMEINDATLVIRTDSGSYTIPASEINIDSVSQQLGTNVSLTDITVTVSVSEPSAAMTQVIENAAQDGGYTITIPAVEYTISCEYNGQTVIVNSFNAYVERTIAIPDGVDPSKLTTGVVVGPDGTVHHVPTKVTVIDSKYYAVINSLTNSAYSVIWNPVEFSDMENHWAKDAVNNMGSRMVVNGVGNNNYDPDRYMTRAEFATIIVRALGLEPGTGESSFDDVASTDWYSGYIETAVCFGIVYGYDNGNYGPTDTITREQAMTMIARAMKITGLESSLTADDISALLSGYADSSYISDYARSPIADCLKTGIVTGRTATAIAPQDFVTRAEVAVMVQRLLQKSELI